MIHRRVRVRERRSVSFDVALLITPTLAFALAVAEILHGRGVAQGRLLGGLEICGAAACFLPLLRRRRRRQPSRCPPKPEDRRSALRRLSRQAGAAASAAAAGPSAR
jgi:hypothetical protein